MTEPKSPWKPVPPPEDEYVFLYGLFGRDIGYPDTSIEHRVVIGVWENDDPNYPDVCYIPAHHCDHPQEITHWAPLLPAPEE